MSVYVWDFSAVDRLGRLITGTITVGRYDLLVIRTSDGGWLGVDPDDQYTELAAALRGARALALTNRDHKRRPASHRKRTRR